jgi:hypothetical protein
VNLREIADAIPDLGAGGKSCADELIALAAAVPSGQTIIDIGPWLGSTTAYLALGVLESGNNVEIHAFDIWEIDEVWQQRAAKFNGIEFPIGTNLEPMWRRNVEPFGVRIVAHRIDVGRAKWGKTPIGLIVDDSPNTTKRMAHTMAIFARHLPVGAGLVLMDWQFEVGTHQAWTKRHADSFELERLCKYPSRAAIFRRTAGEL